MRKFAEKLKRNPGFDYNILDDSQPINREFNRTSEIALWDVAEGETIVDVEYNRPLIKVNGELQQLTVGENGKIYYGVPSNLGAVLSVSNFNSASVATNVSELKYIGKKITKDLAKLGAMIVGVIPPDSTLLRIKLYVVSPFTVSSGNEFEMSIALNLTEIVTFEEIDMTIIGESDYKGGIITVSSKVNLAFNFATNLDVNAEAYILFEYLEKIYV